MNSSTVSKDTKSSSTTKALNEMLGIFMELCEMCRRLLMIVEAQQTELEKLHADARALRMWKRDTDHIKEMFEKIEH